jgi:hypothetical protein
MLRARFIHAPAANSAAAAQNNRNKLFASENILRESQSVGARSHYAGAINWPYVYYRAFMSGVFYG